MPNNQYELDHVPASARGSHEVNPARSARRIVSVVPDSVAAELGICPGDELLEINGQVVKDVFDYRLAILESELRLVFRRANGEFCEAVVTKAEEEDIGLEFAEAMMDDPLFCHNRCLFCFIDQLPPGMRETLYFKDDDMRLSFLSGNYITLTNMKDAELDRLIAYHLSPMNVSVHTTNPDLRKKMLHNRFAVRIMEQLRRIAAAGIEINVQIVLIPGVNDGAELDRTLEDLAGLGESLQSVAVVPVGLTRYREKLKLPHIEPVGRAVSATLLDQTVQWQKTFLERLGRRVLFPADEFYLMAGMPIPEAEAYEGFPQLENGIGLLALFRDEMARRLARLRRLAGRRSAEDGADTSVPFTFHMPVGTAAAPFIEPLCGQMAELMGVELVLHPILNRFFGESITVSGLLTGQDIFEGLRDAVRSSLDQGRKTLVLLGDVMLRQGEEVFLDDWTVTRLETELGVPALVTEADAEGLEKGIRKGKVYTL